jgi:hypothetical protein
MGTEKKEIEAQKALIEGVCLKTGIDTDQLAELIGVKADTVRKLRAGYQLAGEQTLRLIRQVGELKSLKLRDQKRGGSIVDRIEWILQHGTPSEISILREQIAFLFEQVNSRRPKKQGGRVRYGSDAGEE